MRSVRARCARGLVFGAILLAAPVGSAATPPDAAQLKRAAEEFDAAVRLLDQGRIEEAASRFEAADANAPSDKALLQALKARRDAGQGARAATLAEAALKRYPDAPELVALAREVLESVGPSLGKITVHCPLPCVVAVGGRVVLGDAKPAWTIFSDPGPIPVSVSFEGRAAASANTTLQVEAGKESVLDVPMPAANHPESPAPLPREERAPDGLSPLYFWIGTGATVALAGTAVWSHIDARNNPGADVVREKCAGRGTSCPEYQEGVAKDRRTIILGASAGAAGIATALIGILWTNWSGASSAPPQAAALAVDAQRAALVVRGQF